MSEQMNDNPSTFPKVNSGPAEGAWGKKSADLGESEACAVSSKARRPKGAPNREVAEFIHVPCAWEEAADAAVSSRIEFRIALEIYRLCRMSKDGEVKLTNGRLSRVRGATRKAKHKVLAKLEQAGLVELKRNGRQSPLVRTIEVV
jgi:ribosomal protein S19E (S16A)